jgi:hypothetical protein
VFSGRFCATQVDIHADQTKGSDAIGVRLDDKAVAVLSEEIWKCWRRSARCTGAQPLVQGAGCVAAHDKQLRVDLSDPRVFQSLTATFGDPCAFTQVSLRSRQLSV